MRKSPVSKDKLGTSFKICSKNTIETQDDDIPEISLFVFLIYKDGGLGHSTFNFDSILRRLLISATETNYTTLANRSWRTRLSVLFCHPSSLSAPEIRCAENWNKSWRRFTLSHNQYRCDDHHTKTDPCPSCCEAVAARINCTSRGWLEKMFLRQTCVNTKASIRDTCSTIKSTREATYLRGGCQWSKFGGTNDLGSLVAYPRPLPTLMIMVQKI